MEYKEVKHGLHTDIFDPYDMSVKSQWWIGKRILIERTRLYFDPEFQEIAGVSYEFSYWDKTGGLNTSFDIHRHDARNKHF